MADPVRLTGTEATGGDQLWVHDERLLRTRPTQRRAFERVGQILDSAGQLLEELYPEPVTAEKIAARANVRLATFYHYFHGHQAVYGALAARSLERMRAATQRSNVQLSGRAPLYNLAGSALDVALAAWLQQPGGRRLLRLAEAMPEFQEKLEAWTNDAIEGDRLGPMARDPKQWSTQRRFIYPTVLRSLIAHVSLILATEDTDDRRQLTEQAKLAMTAYLSIYLS